MSAILDHGFVRLVDSMPAVNVAGARGLTAMDARVVAAARVSHIGLAHVAEDDDRTGEQDIKLLQYLLRNAHTSPFEQVTLTWHVQAPLFIARQWMRHRSGAFNEVSARYAEVDRDFYAPGVERMREQSASNKQASGDALPLYTAECAANLIHRTQEHAFAVYRNLLKMGVAREVARIVLPVGMYTEFVWTVSLHNLLHFLKLRLHPHAQHEIRVYADAMFEALALLAPVTCAAWAKTHSMKSVLDGHGREASLVYIEPPEELS